MPKPRTETEKIIWCGEQVRVAKDKNPKKYEDIKALVKAEMTKSNVGPLEAAINLCMQVKNDAVLHLWFMGMADCLIAKTD
jgi:hypothetical protein